MGIVNCRINSFKHPDLMLRSPVLPLGLRRCDGGSGFKTERVPCPGGEAAYRALGKVVFHRLCCHSERALQVVFMCFGKFARDVAFVNSRKE